MRKILNLFKSFIIFNLKIVYTIIFLIIFGILIFSSLTSKAEVNYSKYDSVLVQLNDIKEDKIDNLAFLTEDDNTYTDILEKFKYLISNKNFKNIILDMDNISLTATQTEEVLQLLDILKKDGRKIIAYGSYFDNSTYKLASIANKIYMPNSVSSNVLIRGYYSSQVYFKDLFDKYGIVVNSIHTGPNKSLGENYYKSSMSKEVKEQTERIYDTRMKDLAETIEKNRKIQNFLEKSYDGKYFMIDPYEAQDENLIDQTATYYKMIEIEKINVNSMISFLNLPNNTSNSSNNIAIIPLEGEINSNTEDVKNYINEALIEDKINRALSLPNLKAIVLRINSPGGDALQSKLIYEYIKNISKKNKIPVYVSMADVAASGGYYISRSADKVYANKATLTGSVGVVSLIPSISETYKKFNLNNSEISKGKYAGLFNLSYKLNEEDKKLLENSINKTYKEFLSVMPESIDKNDYDKIALGRVWLGSEAKDLKLIDEIGSLYDVINNISKDNNIKDYKLVQINSRKDINSYFSKFKRFLKDDFKIDIKLDFIKVNAQKPLYYIQNIDKIEF